MIHHHQIIHDKSSSAPFGKRKRYAYKVTVDQDLNDKDQLKAVIEDVIAHDKTKSHAIIVWVYGDQDDLDSVYTKAMGIWSKDSNGWSKTDFLGKKLKVEYA